MKKCFCCGGNETEKLFENLYDKNFFIDGKFSLLKCNRCKAEFISPLLNEKHLKKYYPEKEYYSFYDYNKLALFYHKISAYYHSKKNILFSVIFYPFSRILYSYYIDGGKSILEVGCGNGMKLNIYKKYGMKTYGLEPYGPPLRNKEKKLGISKKSIKNADFKKNSFDYIILKEVLEHVPNQKLVLMKCHEWLKPGGKLIITIPNTDGIWKKIFEKNWYGYDIPRHLYNYNKKNFSFFIKKFGFKIEKIRTYDMPYMLDGSLKFYFEDKTGKKDKNFIFSNLMKIIIAPVSLIVTILGMGSIIEAVCSK